MGKVVPTYPLRVAVRRTGLSAERLRAWEMRHDVIRPVRTPGGSRRYTDADLERLRLLREAVEAGHRIGNVAHLDDAALRAVLAPARDDSRGRLDPFEPLWGPLERLEVDEVRRLLEEQRAATGTLDFARDVAVPFLHEVGRRWEQGELSVASEHVASRLLSSMLGAALHARRRAQSGPAIVFATPSGERHELGLSLAALTAAGAGAEPVFLGADVPEEDLVASTLRVQASALALGFVVLPSDEAESLVRRLRERLPARIGIWIGGSGAPHCAPIRGVERIANLDQLASHVALACIARDGRGG